MARMKANTIIDVRHSLQRVGSIHRETGYKIIRCPKCGKKGTGGKTDRTRKDGSHFWTVTHARKLVSICGIAMFEVTDHCSWTEPGEGQ